MTDASPAPHPINTAAVAASARRRRCPLIVLLPCRGNRRQTSVIGGAEAARRGGWTATPYVTAAAGNAEPVAAPSRAMGLPAGVLGATRKNAGRKNGAAARSAAGAGDAVQAERGRAAVVGGPGALE